MEEVADDRVRGSAGSSERVADGLSSSSDPWGRGVGWGAALFGAPVLCEDSGRPKEGPSLSVLQAEVSTWHVANAQ